LHGRARVRAHGLVAIALFVASCSNGRRDDQPPGDPDAGGGGPPDAGDDDIDPIDAGEPQYRFLCDMPPPSGATMPTPPPPASDGCPTLTAGLNAISSDGTPREFILVLPANPLPDETFPVLFMWHWIGGSANSFLERGEVQAAADEQRFIGIIPVAKEPGAIVFGTELDTRWPFDITQSSGRMNEELTFFDDMLSCTLAQLPVKTHCVSSIGVSAGALWNAQLAQERSEQLASFASLSGGVGATIIKPWNGATRKLPALVLWGGDGPPTQDGVKDILGCFGIGMDFSVASHTLEQELTSEGHFVVECKHNCGHVEPPLETPPGQSKFAGMWHFALDHPFWLAAGDSPWLVDGVPEQAPAWCGIGMGGSEPRTGGGCPEPENPCPN
jgi:predicted esterase